MAWEGFLHVTVIPCDRCCKRFRFGNQKKNYVLILKFPFKAVISVPLHVLGDLFSLSNEGFVFSCLHEVYSLQGHDKLNAVSK